MTAYLIVDTKILDQKAYEDYKIRAKPIAKICYSKENYTWKKSQVKYFWSIYFFIFKTNTYKNNNHITHSENDR